jgi:hypothetical protein
MQNICDLVAAIKRADRYYYFHAVNVRTRRDLTLAELRFLRQHSSDAEIHAGQYIHGFSKDVLKIVKPDLAAQQFIAALPGAMINRLEVAKDLIVGAEIKWALRDVFDDHFVQPWHGDQVQWRLNGGSYTSGKRARRKFAWYADEEAKVTGEVDCFHLEGRHVGVQSVRRAGVEHPRDLLTFDHGAYWAKRLTLFEVDYERLGRLHVSRGQRRRRPLLQVSRGGFVFNIDRAVGCILFRALSVHPGQHCRSVQQFVDVYGRGPFLKPHPIVEPLILMFNLHKSKISELSHCPPSTFPEFEHANSHEGGQTGSDDTQHGGGIAAETNLKGDFDQ